jgi:hypothetical protein
MSIGLKPAGKDAIGNDITGRPSDPSGMTKFLRLSDMA